MIQQTSIDGSGELLAGAKSPPTFKLFGDSAVLIEFGQTICVETQALVHRLDAAITADPMRGLVETIPAYTTLAVVYDPLLATPDDIAAEVLARFPRAAPATAARRTWQVPVAYGGEHGVDIGEHADACGLTTSALISAHASADYIVAMFGFLPGFAYLSGLPPTLSRARRSTPRPKVPPGTIAIGGAQTAIGSIEGPSGWHVIGRTPFRAFDVDRDPATVLQVGDRIQFVPIPHEWFAELDAAAAAGEIVAEAML